MRILVVDDEAWVLETVRRYLEQAGFEVVPARDGMSALEAFERSRPDLVILDWMLPKLDGLSVASRIRASSSAPIIMLTARVTEQDRLAGFDAGIDDYIIKPFSARELEARIHAVLRRSSNREPSVQESGNLRLDREQRLVWVEGEPVELSAMGFDLLAFLMAHPGRVFTRLELLEAVRGEAYSGFERSIDSHIKRLRQKVEADPARPVHILTVFGVGYRFARWENE